MMTKIHSSILSQYLSYHVSIQWIKSLLIFYNFRSYNLYENPYFLWIQLIDSTPKRWKFIIKENYEKATNLVIHDHHLIKGSKVLTLDELTSIEIYSVLISKVQNKDSSNIHFEICLMTIILT